MIFTVLPSPISLRAWSRARRAICELKPPHRPRSAVATTSRWTSSLPVPAISAGASDAETAWPILAITAAMRSEEGRAASAASWARRSFAAATICIALVIFCVALTEAMRLRRSFSEAMRLPYPLVRRASDEVLGECVDLGLELGAQIVRQRLLLADRVQHRLAVRAHVRQQALLELRHLVDGEVVEVAVDAGEDHRDLLFRLQRRELRLLEQLGQARTAIEEALRCGIEVGAELRERSHLAILGELALD